MYGPYNASMSETPSPRLPEPDRPWMMRTYAGHSDAKRSNELYRRNLEKGQTGLSIAFDLPTQTGYDPDHELARGEVGKVGVSIAHRGRHAHAAGRDSAGSDEHLDDDQRHRRVATGALHRRRRGSGPAHQRGQAPGHDPERHPQGVPEPGHLRLPARPEHAADRRHDRLHGHARTQVEPDQHLLLPPSGGGSDAGPGDRLRDEQRDRRARRRARACPGRPDGQRLRPDLVLRQRRGSLHRGARQAPRDVRRCGTSWVASATASPTRSIAVSATASKSTRSASPSSNRRTTSTGSHSRRSR